ncbi:MAG: ribosome-binding factor A [Actinomycetota bacterium]|jgi:ribosome-binding factor A|nr:ribosome-binding factor A [Actinomycetota bacterium]
MPDGGRRYPRMARVNELVREVVAEELERLADDDERLALLTVTAVEVDADLRHGRVLLSSLPGDAEEALVEHRVRLQAALSRQVRLKRTPQLSFAADPAVESGKRVEDILRDLRQAEGDDVGS